MKNKNYILGIDPGLNNTGWGVVESINNKEIYISHGVIKTESKNILGERLNFIYDNLSNLFKKLKPCHVTVEKIITN